jgi:riboflavin kinase/FMN adenylyltransferase
VWISHLDIAKIPTRIALGNFDGIHQGHHRVIRQIFTEDDLLKHSSDSAWNARSLAPHYLSALLECLPTTDLKDVGTAIASADQFSPPFQPGERSPVCSELDCTAYPTVVTFYPHPQEFFTGQSRPLLTPFNEKLAYLKLIGVKQLVLLPFNQALAQLTAQAFVEAVLIEQLQPQIICVGQDFRFGQNRSGTIADLRAIAAQHHIPVHTAPLLLCEGERISSSAIRLSLQCGNLDKANQLLGRPYALIGKVIKGQQLGRTLGFPTANLALPAEKFLPKLGVYAVEVYASAWQRTEPVCWGVMNLGLRPTVNGIDLATEVHLLDWDGDLYGQTLAVGLKAFLRPEQKFASLNQLKQQIQIDCEMARSVLQKAAMLD